MSCSECKYWKMPHWGGNKEYNGCTLWNNLKLFGKKLPYTASSDFDKLVAEFGPEEAYEGWATNGAGMAYNYAMLTKGNATCHYFEEESKDDN